MYEMYAPQMMPYYDPRMMQQPYLPEMGMSMPPATSEAPHPFDFDFIRPIGWELGHKPEKENRKPSRDKKAADLEEADPLADIKRREIDLNTEKHARELELQQEYETRLAEFDVDYKQKERELEKEKLDLERRLI